ncbi:MAG TPA: hypothetical protein VJP79_07980, partial [Nitrososphaera sp.]|nr:hypothetical protein [Nitrososphaera sp.]
EFVMEVAKILANSSNPVTVNSVNGCFTKALSPSYVSGALSVCNQLGLAKEKQGEYYPSDTLRDDIKQATKEQLFVPFEACLKNYAPFLLYIDFASKGYNSTDAAARTKGILQVKGTANIVEQSLRRWGIYAKLIDYDKMSGKVNVRVKVEKLSAEYVMKLLGAFEAELKTKVFVIDMLGAETYAFMDSKGVDIEELSGALLGFEADPDSAAAKSTKALELFLWRLGEDKGINVTGAKGLIELGDLLKGNKVILNSQNHILHGMGGIRNMTHHAPDKETSQPWVITKQGALLTTLFTPTVIRSLYLYYKNRKQEL